MQIPAIVPHLTAGGTAFGGQTVAPYVKYGENHQGRRCVSEPSLSWGGIKLSHRLGHWLEMSDSDSAPRNKRQRNVDEPAHHQHF
jgi:hypothetical protein